MVTFLIVGLIAAPILGFLLGPEDERGWAAWIAFVVYGNLLFWGAVIFVGAHFVVKYW